MGKYQLKPIDAIQVPVREENEADKDLEQRYAKVCAWLDEMGAVDISFQLPKENRLGFVRFKLDELQTGYKELRQTVPNGLWIIWDNYGKYRICSDESFKSVYEEVN